MHFTTYRAAKFLLLNMFLFAAPLSAQNEAALRIGLDEFAIELNPHLALTRHSQAIMANLFEPLLRVGANGQLKAGLATHWIVDDDGTTYRFRLRDGAYWSDGVKITAANVATAMNQHSSQMALLSSDNDTPPFFSAMPNGWLTMELGAPIQGALTFLTNPAYAPHPAHIMEQLDYSTHWGTLPPEQLVYSGPYRLENGDEDVLVLRPNPYYFAAEQVRNYGVDIPLSPREVSTILGDYLSQDLDLLYLSTQFESAFLQNLDADLVEILPSENIDIIKFNTEMDPINDESLRRALAMSSALPHDLRRIRDGIIQPQTSFILEAFESIFEPYEPYWDRLSEAERVAEAQRLMQELGYSETNRIKLTLDHIRDDSYKVSKIQVLRSKWSLIYVDLEFRSQSFDALIERMVAGDYQLSAITWYFADDDRDVDGVSTPFSMYDVFGSSSPYNLSRYSNPALDALLIEIGETESAERLNALSLEVQEILMTDVPAFPLTTSNTLVLKQPNLTVSEPGERFSLSNLAVIGY